MCGGKAPKTVRSDPEADAARIAAEAAVTANSEAAARRRARRISSLGATRSTDALAEPSPLQYGNTVLGG